MQDRLSIRSQRQRGVALFTVVVFVMLSMLLALWASRTALFGEALVGNDADYQRAFEAAQALLQDAELDIRGENADGTACSGSGDVCRTSTAEKIPLEARDVTQLLLALGRRDSQCSNGLCAKRSGKQDFWNNNDPAKGTTLDQMTSGNVGVSIADATPIGARYGQYTGAQLGDSTKPANPILADRATSRGGWYWIEVLPYTPSSASAGLIMADDGAGNTTVANNYLPLSLQPNVVYRITALAYGLKPNTRVVLQQTYARQRLKD